MGLIPLVFVAIISPVAMVSAMMRVYHSGNRKDAFAVYEVMREVIPRLKASLFPLLQYFGILALGFPLIGFAVFLGTLPLLAQLVLVFRQTDADLKSSGF